MPRIDFLVSVSGGATTLDAPEGGALIDLCDERLAPVPFSCRSATCGTCQVHVVEGAERLLPPEEAERELLALLDGPPDVRLACQVRVRAGDGVVALKPIGA
ncbi:MAG: 2Fe-2S iron-sulfur cluster-binding protein [Sorangiineae bacterium]|nr:2Fe-2S iron-sulfur cluster-binding protein [Polyangiaceae bacterium]MEB2324326.1 2Fe-2S iron-sulfur cluster-binding protein [Sorangiineae bacterium]